MILLIISILIGSIIGIFLKDKKFLINTVSKFIQIVIYLLLFVMGYKMAMKRQIFYQNKYLFFESLVSSIILFLVFLLYGLSKKILLKKNNSQKNKEKIILENQSSDDIKSDDIKYDEENKNNKLAKQEIFTVLINIFFIILGFSIFFLLDFLLKSGLSQNENLINSVSEYILIFLLFFIGVDLGRNFSKIKSQKLKFSNIFLPFISILLTLISSLIFSLIFSKKILDGMAIFGGLGWYSLSSVLLSVKGLTVLAIYSFIHNIFREIIAIISSPIVAKLDPELPILIGGATSMDVMLPFVQKYSGHNYTLLSFYSGAICSISVSFIINGLIGAIL